MGRGSSGASGGGGGAKAAGKKVEQPDTFKMGDTVFSVTKDGKNYYLVMQTGVVKDKYKIAYAGSDDKAHVTVPYVGVINLNSEPGILNLLKRKRSE